MFLFPLKKSARKGFWNAALIHTYTIWVRVTFFGGATFFSSSVHTAGSGRSGCRHCIQAVCVLWWWAFCIFLSTHRSLVLPYGIIKLGQHLGQQMAWCLISTKPSSPDHLLILMSIRPLRANFNEILIRIQTCSVKKCIWKCHLQNVSHFVQALAC